MGDPCGGERSAFAAKSNYYAINRLCRGRRDMLDAVAAGHMERRGVAVPERKIGFYECLLGLKDNLACHLHCVSVMKVRGHALRLTAHAPATLATMPDEIIIGRRPRVLLKMAPLNAPATTEFVISCFPLKLPMVLLMPL
jgi:hypothetical protein